MKALLTLVLFLAFAMRGAHCQTAMPGKICDSNGDRRLAGETSQISLFAPLCGNGGSAGFQNMRPFGYQYIFDTKKSRRQGAVDYIMRHYRWRPAVAVNARCVRSLSCGSLYEQSLRRPAIDSPR